MKKIFAILMAGLMAAAAVGCGASEPSSASSAPASSSGSVSSSAPASSQPASSFDNTSDITVISREPGSGTRGAFIELFGIVVKGADGTKTDTTTEEAVIANKTDVVLQSVAGNDYSIGYISLGSLNDTVKALKIDGVAPSAEGVLDGSYKVARPFMIATKGEPTGLAKDFIDFIMSKEGQEIVAKGYVPVAADAAAYAGTKPSGKIVVGGSSSVTPVMEKLAEAYKAVNTGAEIEIQMTDSTAGMTGAVDGVLDIGMASRELKDSEKEQLTGLAIAQDGIAVVVSNNNPNEEMTSEQVKAVFTGEATTWDAIG